MNKNGFRIDFAAIIFYLILATALLFVVNVHNIWQFLVAQTSGGTTAKVDYSAISPHLFTYLNKFNSVALMAFYAGIGTVVYFVAAWLQMAFSSTLREAKEAGYVKPAAVQTQYWHKVLESNLAGFALLIGWIASLYIFGQLLLPRFCKLVNYSLNSGTLGQRAADLAGALALTTICLFAIVRLSHVLRLSWQRFTAA